MIAHDEGPGIANVELALQDGYTTGGGLGLGLPGARRLVRRVRAPDRAGAGDDGAPGEVGARVR